MKNHLKTIHIENYLSLRKVSLPLKPLTVLVGPNSCGKSNTLEAIRLLKIMMREEELPPVGFINDQMWAGGADNISLTIECNINNKKSKYTVSLVPKENNQILKEELRVGRVKVISVQNGKGFVVDEDGKDETKYDSIKLALKSAGNYGEKPVTKSLNTFIREWEFYDFDTDALRYSSKQKLGKKKKSIFPKSSLDILGRNLGDILVHWHEKYREIFNEVSELFKKYSKFELDVKESSLQFFEGYSKPILTEKISEGTLRLLAYLVLFYQDPIPPLIAIEEPEKNLHPAWLGTLSDILTQLSQKTQVIITTHSSQLLDFFSSASLGKDLAVLLLKNISGQGSEAITLDQARNDRIGLQKWIDEFGIGSAIFDSEILQDLMETGV